VLVDAADPAFRARYAALADEQEEALLQALGEAGADVIELATDDDLLNALLRFCDLRRQRARLKPAARRFPAAMRRAPNASDGSHRMIKFLWPDCCG
jgi:hypothetical protein